MNPYKILNVNRNSKPEEIKKAYFKLAFKYHPDRNKDKPLEIQKEYENKLKEVNEAYNMISKNGNTESNDFTNKTFYNDIAEKMVKEAALFGKYFFDMVQDQTEDLNVNLNIDLFDIYNNIEKTFTLKIKKKCKGCMGMGVSLINKEFITCSKCLGLKILDTNKEFTILSGEGKHIFFKQSHEEYGKKTGNVVVNIIPKNDAKYKVINNYDLLLNFYDLDVSFEHLDKKKYSIDNAQYYKTYIYKNMGLYNNKFVRGNLHVQILPQKCEYIEIN